MEISKNHIEKLSDSYDQEYPWWVEREEELGQKIRNEKQFGKEVLFDIVDWKFYTLPGRIKRTRNLLEDVNDAEIMQISRKALSPGIEEGKRINELRKIKGVGISLASVILTFYDPEQYCVYDIHVMRELYGEEPKYMFTKNDHYLRLLKDIREIRNSTGLPVRTIEKALFYKNIK
jgi:thermostable 8-oxoguanine DNA glycosylase